MHQMYNGTIIFYIAGWYNEMMGFRVRIFLIDYIFISKFDGYCSKSFINRWNRNK